MDSIQANKEIVSQIIEEIQGSDDNPITQINPALIALLLELLPILVKFITEQCEKNASYVISESKSHGMFSRIWLNRRVKRELGWQAWRALGARDCGISIMKVVGNEANTAQVEALFADPPEWGVADF